MESKRFGERRYSSPMNKTIAVLGAGNMAGGALGGVFGAGLRLFGWYREDLIKLPFYDHDGVSQIVSAVGFVLLCVYLWRESMKKERTA